MPPLRLGTVGDDVTSLQLALVSIGLLAGEPSGAFDQTTHLAVLEMQRRSGLTQTGVMDDASWNALWRMQASVAESPDTNTPGTGPRPGTTYLEPTEVSGKPGRGLAIFMGLLAAGAYWYTHKQSSATNEYDDEDDEPDEDDDDEEENKDEDDEEDEALDWAPPSRRGARGRMADLNDAVTDSLIDEPARIARGGSAADCKKAAMRLMRVQALVQKPSERSLYESAVKKVKSNCTGQSKEGAILDAIFEEQARRDELADELGNKLVATLETRVTETDEGTRKRTFVAPGFRKTKQKFTRKTTGSDRSDPGVRGRGRRGASAVEVRRGGKKIHSLRKEKAKTKRGYTWRKED